MTNAEAWVLFFQGLAWVLGFGCVLSFLLWVWFFPRVAAQTGLYLLAGALLSPAILMLGVAAGPLWAAVCLMDLAGKLNDTTPPVTTTDDDLISSDLSDPA